MMIGIQANGMSDLMAVAFSSHGQVAGQPGILMSVVQRNRESVGIDVVVPVAEPVALRLLLGVVIGAVVSSCWGPFLLVVAVLVSDVFFFWVREASS